MVSFFLDQIRHQFYNLPLSLTPEDCKGKTYIVTGANIGLGFECAKHLVELQSKRVILTARSVSGGQDALADIEAQTGRKGVAEVWALDLSSYESVKAFAGRVTRELERVDAVVENAATAVGSWALAEGRESTVTVNVVSTFLLAILLMPHLEACAKRYSIQPRICIVASGLAFGREADLARIGSGNILDDLDNSSKWSMGGAERYALSKLLQVFAIRRIASIAPTSRTGVVINILDPGLCKTGLTRNSDSATKFMVGVMRALIGRTAEWGSRTLLFGIAAEDSHGKYFSYCQEKEVWVPDWVSNDAGQEWGRRVWNDIARELDSIAPGCVRVALKRGF